MMKFESGRIASVSRPLKRATPCFRLRDAPRRRSPPRPRRSPGCGRAWCRSSRPRGSPGRSRRTRAAWRPSPAASRRSRRRRWAGPRSGSSSRRHGATPASSARKGRISSAPSAQLMPTASGRACATDVQKASTVWPERVRPLLSVMVTEIISGSSTSLLREDLLRRDDGGLGVQRVEDGLDQQEVDAALDESAHLLRVGLAQRVEADRAERRVVHVRRDARASCCVGPMAPATKRGLSGVRALQASATLRASRAASRLISVGEMPPRRSRPGRCAWRRRCWSR